MGALYQTPRYLTNSAIRLSRIAQKTARMTGI
jgi:hypothetical protein